MAGQSETLPSGGEAAHIQVDAELTDADSSFGDEENDRLSIHSLYSSITRFVY